MAEPVTHSLVKALRAVPVFAAFDERTLVKIVGVSANLFWPAGTPVFEKGGESEALYIVLSGVVRIIEVTDDPETEVAQLGPGEFFGELSLLLHTTHTKSAVALEDSELMVIPKASFQDLLAAYPELAAEFRLKAEERLGAQPQVARLT
jgi:CRP/FNR family cyclic AMP-dependent transcriptional regulator